MALREDLGHLGRTQDDAEPLARQPAKQRVDVRLRRQIDSARRLVEQQHRRRGVETAGENRLLLVAARQRRDRDVRRRRPHARVGHEPFPVFPAAPAIDPARARRPLLRRQDHVLENGEIRKDRLRLALLGKQDEPGRLCVGGARGPIVLPGDAHPARHRPFERARECEQEVRAARPDQSCETENLSSAQREGDVRDAPAAGSVRVRDREVLDAEHLRRILRDRQERDPVDPAAHHETHHLGLVHGFRLARDDAFSVAKHRDPIGQPLDLVELVRDVDDRHPAGRQPLDQALEAGGLRRRQRGGRLVHDDEPRFEREGAGDGHELPLTGFQMRDELLGRNVRLAKPLERRRRPGEKRPGTSEEDVLRDRERRDELELLRNDGDAGLDGVPRSVHPARLAVDPDFTGIVRDLARENPDQRRFARAVLPDERVHLPGPHVEVHAVQRPDTRELLRDAASLDEGGHARPRRNLLHEIGLLPEVVVELQPVAIERVVGVRAHGIRRDALGLQAGHRAGGVRE